MTDQEAFAQIGEQGIANLVAAFYRQVPADDILGPMYPRQDLANAEQRLRDFLLHRFGNNPKYTQERGHPRLRMRHMPFAIDERARDRWLHLMEQALTETQIPEAPAQVLRAYFISTADFMRNR